MSLVCATPVLGTPLGRAIYTGSFASTISSVEEISNANAASNIYIWWSASNSIANNPHTPRFLHSRASDVVQYQSRKPPSGSKEFWHALDRITPFACSHCRAASPHREHHLTHPLLHHNKHQSSYPSGILRGPGGTAEAVSLGIPGKSIATKIDHSLGYVKGILSLGPSLKYLRIDGAKKMDAGPIAPMTQE